MKGKPCRTAVAGPQAADPHDSVRFSSDHQGGLACAVCARGPWPSAKTTLPAYQYRGVEWEVTSVRGLIPDMKSVV